MKIKNYFSLDFESLVSTEDKFLKMTSERRKEIDNGYIKNSTKLILDNLEKHKQKIDRKGKDRSVLFC